MKAYHRLITGPSGGGKTTLARQAHVTFRGPSILLTTKDRESGVKGDRVSGRGRMDTLTRENWGALENLRMKWFDASYPEATSTAREWAKDIRRESGYPVQILVDECQNTPLSSGKGALKAGLHEDRDEGIKWVPITQAPQDLKEQRGYPGINQCEFIMWAGPARTFHEGFITYYNLDGMLPEEIYRYHVIEPSRPPKVVERGETDPSY